MGIIFFCPQCGREISVRSAAAGREGRCLECGEKVVIPDLFAIGRRPLPETDGDSAPGKPLAVPDEEMG
jgi:DNA-directed RNA polymerase subunit RPC12/RpoP